MTQPRKKLIEVALPLALINQAAAEEKVISTGIPANLHAWWSRKPLAACRAVLFAQLVDDPSDCLDEFPSEELQNAERQRLLRLIEQLVKHENLNDATTLHEAQVEIARSAARSKGVQLDQSLTQAEVIEALQRYAPAFLDPFCGGGSIPLEAQRLGLKVFASDLNPVAVLINKVQIELLPQFAGRAPINPNAGQTLLKQEWRGTQGLAEDIRYYGAWIQEQVEKRIGHLYPTVTLPKEYGGGQEPVIAWIWARTVRCPNPVCRAQMPLVSKFWVSTHQKNEAWVEPVVDRAAKTVQFTIRTGQGSPPAGTIDQTGARCLVCGEHAAFEHIRFEGQAGRMGYHLMAIVTQGPRGRLYLPPDESHIHIAASEQPSCPDFSPKVQGLTWSQEQTKATANVPRA